MLLYMQRRAVSASMRVVIPVNTKCVVTMCEKKNPPSKNNKDGREVEGNINDGSNKEGETEGFRVGCSARTLLTSVSSSWAWWMLWCGSSGICCCSSEDGCFGYGLFVVVLVLQEEQNEFWNFRFAHLKSIINSPKGRILSLLQHWWRIGAKAIVILILFVSSEEKNASTTANAGSCSK